MRLITLENEMPVFNPEIRMIKEFKAILVRDKDKYKVNANKELAFIHFYCTYDSRFELYDNEEERIEAIITSVGLPEDWEYDSLIKQACTRYTDMMQTRTMKLAKSMRDSITTLENFLANVDLEERNNSGNYVFDAVKYQNTIQKMADTIEAMAKVDEIIDKELSEKISGDKKVKKKERSLVSQNKLTITDSMKI